MDGGEHSIIFQINLSLLLGTVSLACDFSQLFLLI